MAPRTSAFWNESMSVYDTADQDVDASAENDDQTRLWTYGEEVVRRTDSIAAESGCSRDIDNCPGPNPEIHIEDGKAVIDGVIPCAKCFLESLNDCAYEDLE